MVPCEGTNRVATTEESQRIRSRIRGALLNYCFSQGRTGLIAGIVGSTVIVAVLWNEAHRSWLLIWLVAVALSIAVGQLAGKAFKKTSPQGEAVDVWERLYVSGAVVCGLIWGSTGLLMFPVDSMPHQFFLALLLAGVASVEVILLSANVFACTSAVMLTLLPVGARFAYEGTEFYITIGISLALFAFILLIAGHRLHRVLSDSIELSFIRDDLYEHILQEKSRVETLYNNLKKEVELHKHTTQALRDSQKRYRALVEDTTDLICRLMSSGRISYVNEAACACLGKQAEEFLGESFLSIFPEDDHEVVQNILQSLGSDCPALTTEHRIRNFEGALRWIQWSYRALFGGDGKIVEYQAVGRDITDRKRAEDALESSERRFRSFVETASDVIWTLNLDLRFTYVSPSVTQLLGYSVEEIMLLNPLKTLTRDSRDLVIRALHEEMEAERITGPRKSPRRFEVLEQYRKDGSLIQIEITVTFLRDSSGRPTGVLGISRDVTERRIMEDKIRQSEERYRLLVETMNDGLAMNDENGRFVFVNSGFCRIVGYDREEIMGKRIRDFIAGESVPTLTEECSSRQGGQKHAAYELTLVRKDGSAIPVFVSTQGMYDDSGRYKGSISVSKNLAEIRRLEDALRDSAEKYRALVENAREGILVVQNERLKYVNPKASEKWKIPLQEVGSKPVWEIIHPDHRELWRNYYSRVLQGHSLPHHETKIVLPDGQIRWVQVTGVSMTWDGSPAVLVFAADITWLKEVEEILRESHDELEARVRRQTEDLESANERLSREIQKRIQMQEELKISEQRYRDLAELLPQMVFEADLAECVTFLNRAGQEACGSTSANLERGIGLSDIFLGKGFDDLRTEIKQADADHRFAGREVSVKHKDGTSFPAMVYSSPICDGETVTGIRGVAVDITKRKRYEMQLEESERRFRAVFDQAHDCIFLKDQDLKYSHVNPAMLSLMELQEKETVGLLDDDIFGPQQADQLKRLDLRALQGQVIESEHTLTLGGRQVTFNCIRMPLTDATGNAIGVCGIARDVTERKATQSVKKVGEPASQSQAMRGTLRQARLAAKSDSLVLLLGESGSGKDYLARYIHRASTRSGSPFFSINCAALAPELAESELFGHEPGSFTGARGRKRGMVELAEGGTLLLNEIGELSLPMQAKLLSFLDNRSITRVGGEREIEVDARIIAATNRCLAAEAEEGRFRNDLFHRLNVFTICLPPLRERLEDLPVLVESILAELTDKLGLGDSPLLDSRLMRLLASYHWPGNIRELKNVLERAVILSEGKKIDPRHVRVEPSSPAPHHDAWSYTVTFPETGTNLNNVTREVKAALVKEALTRAGNKRKDAALLLGISADALKHHMRSLPL